MAAQNIVSWLCECFREDRSRSGMGDFFASGVLHRRLLGGREELACGWMPETVVSPSYAAKAGAHAALYRREQEVVYACLFLCGEHEGKPFRAPLLLYDGNFEGDGYARFRIEINRWRINARVLEILQTDAEALTSIMRGGELSDGTMGEIHEWADALGVDADALWQWPSLTGKKSMDAARSSARMALLPAAGIGILPRSVSLRGVIDELHALAETDTESWSEPLRIMLGEASAAPRSGSRPVMPVPALLSRAQEKIVQSSQINPVTLCHGPPGTGKSFTIAAVALSHVAIGQSVIVASHMDHAVDVVEEKIDAMLGGAEVTVRAGRRGYLPQLKKFMEACLSGQIIADLPDDSVVHELSGQVRETMRCLRAEEREMEEEWRMALSRGALMAKPDPHLWDRIKRRWVKHRVGKRPLLMEFSARLNELYAKRESELGRYLRLQRKHLLGKALKNDSARRDFKMMLRALRKYRGSEQEEIFRKMDVRSVLSALPVWLVNFKDVHRVLPLERGLFDVAIIDESSQCDLASVLPVIQRAKRLVVAGDANQLRHISFLPRLRQKALAEEAGVGEEDGETYDYRDVSLMDHAAAMVESQSQVGFLNEHFRSSPRIIAFSNRKFYRNSLQVMRERPWEEEKQALVGVRCHGLRDEAGVNRNEVDAVIGELGRSLESAAMLPAARRPSFGILSPFRNQVEAIRAAVRETFDSKTMNVLLGDHDLRIGTAYGFQGEERDVMLISLCVDAETGASVLRFVEREDVFNVSITRARSRQVVFHSLETRDLPPGSMLGEYLAELENTRKTALPASSSDRFAREVASAMEGMGIQVEMACRVAGVSVDLLLIDGEDVMGIDLVGYPGEMFDAVDLHRTKILRRAGFRLFPLGYAEWIAQKDHAVGTMVRELRHPSGQESRPTHPHG